MNLASLSENKEIEKRLALTPEIIKKYIDLGFNLFLPNNYGSHLGFDDKDYKSLGVNFLDSEKEIVDNADIIIQLGIPEERFNLHGGAVSLGHPLGSSGTRCLMTMLGVMRRTDARSGIVTLCLGGGNAVAMLLRRTSSTS